MYYKPKTQLPITRSKTSPSDSFAGYKQLIVIDGLEAKVKKAAKSKKLKRCNFLTVIKPRPLPVNLFKTLPSEKFAPNLDIYSVTKPIKQ